MSKTYSTLWLATTLTLVSAASMALEIVAGRALAPYVGMSLYTWTVIIAVVLAGLSLGHWIGGGLADRSQRPGRWVFGTLLGAALTSGVSLLALRWMEPLAVGTNPVSHVSLLALAAFFLPSLMAGVISPLLTKMALDGTAPDHHGRIIGRMFALGAAGAILGTLFAGLVLISWVGTTGSVLLITVTYLMLAISFFGDWRAWFVFVPLGFVLVKGDEGALASLGGGACTLESAYFCIRVDSIQMLGRDAKVMALDHLAHGVNDREDPLLLLSPYVHGVDELLRHRGVEGPAAFFIGGGAYTLPRAWVARWPAAQLVMAEVDPDVTRLAREELWLGSPANLTVIHRDARVALQDLPADAHFDVIFGDAFHDISVPQHLVTDEFHAQLAARLTPGGVYAMNVVDKLREPLFVLSLAQTLGRQFSHVELWLDLQAIRPTEARTTWIVLASDTPTRTGEVTSTYGFERKWVQVPVAQMVDTVGADRLVTLTDDYAPVDRLLGDLLLSGELLE
ncbi:MAG: fused MFS/spermidine synthase [Paracoccaceae bacterium]